MTEEDLFCTFAGNVKEIVYFVPSPAIVEKEIVEENIMSPRYLFWLHLCTILPGKWKNVNSNWKRVTGWVYIFSRSQGQDPKRYSRVFFFLKSLLLYSHFKSRFMTMKMRLDTVWMLGWYKISGVLCGKRLSLRRKGINRLWDRHMCKEHRLGLERKIRKR